MPSAVVGWKPPLTRSTWSPRSGGGRRTAAVALSPRRSDNVARTAQSAVEQQRRPANGVDVRDARAADILLGRLFVTGTRCGGLSAFAIVFVVRLALTARPPRVERVMWTECRSIRHLGRTVTACDRDGATVRRRANPSVVGANDGRPVPSVARGGGPHAGPHGPHRAVPAIRSWKALHDAGFRFFTRSGVAAVTRTVRRVGGAARHRAHRAHRARHRGAGRDLLRALHHRVRAAPAAPAAHVARRPARRGPEPDLRPLGPRSSCSRGRSTLSRWLATHLGFIPFFHTAGTGQRRELSGLDVHRRHRRRADDRADLHRGHARGVLAGARRARRRARSRSAARSGA